MTRPLFKMNKRIKTAEHWHSCRHGAITHCWHRGFCTPHFSFMAAKFSHPLGCEGERWPDLCGRPPHGQKVRVNSSHSAGFQSDVCSGSLQESHGHNGRSLHSIYPGTILREQSLQLRLQAWTHQTLKLHFTGSDQEVVFSNIRPMSFYLICPKLNLHALRQCDFGRTEKFKSPNLTFCFCPNKQLYSSCMNIFNLIPYTYFRHISNWSKTLVSHCNFPCHLWQPPAFSSSPLLLIYPQEPLASFSRRR